MRENLNKLLKRWHRDLASLNIEYDVFMPLESATRIRAKIKQLSICITQLEQILNFEE